MLQQSFTGILQFLDPSSLNSWLLDNIIWTASLFFVMAVGIYFFLPLVGYQLSRLRRLRQRWVYSNKMGRMMSKRAKDCKIAKRTYDMLLDAIRAGEITHKDKRRYLRTLELAFELPPGTLRPKPAVVEIKRRIKGRLSAASANVTELPLARRLAMALSTKGE